MNMCMLPNAGAQPSLNAVKEASAHHCLRQNCTCKGERGQRESRRIHSAPSGHLVPMLLGWHATASGKTDSEAEVAKRTGQGHSGTRWSPFPSPDGQDRYAAESSVPMESPELGTA